MNEPKLLIQCDAVKEPPKESGEYDTDKGRLRYSAQDDRWIKNYNTNLVPLTYLRPAAIEEVKKLHGLFDKEEVDKHADQQTAELREENERLKKEKANLIKEIQRLRDETGMCKCPPEQRTGDTQLMCCNNCGKRSEKF